MVDESGIHAMHQYLSDNGDFYANITAFANEICRK